MDPYQVITWVPPEGGGGPQYDGHVTHARARVAKLAPQALEAAADRGARAIPLINVLGPHVALARQGLEHFDGIFASGQVPRHGVLARPNSPALYYFRRRGIVVITSDNFDGEWTARIIHRFGYTTARGSTSRNAVRAALRAKRRMEEGHPVGFTVDGPVGPRMVAQPGAVWLAKVTGNPILPFHVEAASHWTAPSWDASQIP